MFSWRSVGFRDGIYPEKQSVHLHHIDFGPKHSYKSTLMQSLR